MGGGGVVLANAEPSAYMHLVNPNRRWNNNSRLIKLHAWIFLFLFTSSANGFDNSLMNGFQSLEQWEGYFGHPEGGKLGLLNAIQNIGSLAGYPFAPYVSDGLGRRSSVWFGACMMLIGVAVQSAAQNIGMFIGSRFLIGFGLTFASNAAPMIVAELAYPPYRSTITSLFNALWTSGHVVAAWTTFGTHRIPNEWAWRIPSMMQALPSIFQFFLVWFAPESPRWLMTHGRDAEGLHILAYYHADGDEQDPLVQYEYEEIRAAIELDRQIKASVSWKSLFATPGNRKRMIVITCLAWFAQWSGNGLVSYYLNKILNNVGITDTDTQLLIAAVLACYTLTLGVTISFFVDKFGRRPLFLVSVGGCLVFFCGQTVCYARYAMTGNIAAGHAYIAFIFLYSTAYALALTPLIVLYTVEIMPTPLRAKGVNWFYFVGSVAIIFNQYVNPIALSAIGWKYYLVYCVWLAVELVVTWFVIVETKNRTLEETAALFDGEDLSQRVAPLISELHVDEKASDKASEERVEKV